MKKNPFLVLLSLYHSLANAIWGNFLLKKIVTSEDTHIRITATAEAISFSLCLECMLTQEDNYGLWLPVTLAKDY